MNEEDFKTLCGLILTLMVCFGLIGNTISFITWRKGPRCKTFPGSVYLCALAVSDNLILLTSGVKYVIELLFTTNLWNLGIVPCKLFHTTWHLFFLVSTWIVVSLTIERTIAVRRPLKRRASETSKKRELMVVLFYCCVFLLINLPFTIGATMRTGSISQGSNSPTETTSELAIEKRNISVSEEIDMKSNASSPRNTEEKTCQADPSSFYFKYENEYHNWFIDFTLLFSAPLLILTVCNTIILITLCRRKTVLVGTDSQQHCKSSQSLSGSLTARVIALSIVQCISVGPYSVAALIPGVLPDTQAVDTLQFINRMFIIFALIWYLNNCANFILYSMFGQAFRQDCINAVFGGNRKRSEGRSGGFADISIEGRSNGVTSSTE